MSGVAGTMSAMMSNQYGNMSDQDLRRQYDAYSRMGGGIMGGIGSFFGSQRNAMQAEIQRRQMLGNFGMPQQGSGGGPGAAFTDPNNTTTTGNFSINPNAGGIANVIEATGAPMGPQQMADGSEGYAVNRFGGFAGTTGGGTIPANVATANNFSTDTTKAAAQIFGNSTQFQPRKRLITL